MNIFYAIAVEAVTVYCAGGILLAEKMCTPSGTKEDCSCALTFFFSGTIFAALVAIS